MQKYANLIDLVKSFLISLSNKIFILTRIYLQTSASMQPRTNLSKFGGDSIHFFVSLLTRQANANSGSLRWSKRGTQVFRHNTSRRFRSGCLTAHKSTRISCHLDIHGDKLARQYFSAMLRVRIVSLNSAEGRPRAQGRSLLIKNTRIENNN